MAKIAFGLPYKAFFWTLDQIAFMLVMDEQKFRMNLVFFDGKMPGVPPNGRMLARNLAEPDQETEWRVSDTELKRWLRFKGYRIYDRSSTD